MFLVTVPLLLVWVLATFRDGHFTFSQHKLSKIILSTIYINSWRVKKCIDVLNQSLIAALGFQHSGGTLEFFNEFFHDDQVVLDGLHLDLEVNIVILNLRLGFLQVGFSLPQLLDLLEESCLASFLADLQH